MPLPKLPSSIYLLTLFFVLQAALGDDPLGEVCSNSNFTAGTPYEANLNTLVNYVYFSTPMTGFGLGVIGQTPDQLNGLASCGPNVSSSECKTCVVNATARIRESCPYGKQASIFYDKCMLKYSDEDFFGQIDYSSQFAIWDLQNASDPLTFNEKAKKLLRKLAKETAKTSKFYAAGELGIGGDSKIYGSTQCTRDLSCGDCLMCLGRLVDELSDGKRAVRIVSGSCSIRYQMSPFISV